MTTLRCLFEMSCMPKDERDYRKLMKGGQVDLVAFKAFCDKNPQFVRRLRETAIRCGKGPTGKELPSDVSRQEARGRRTFLEGQRGGAEPLSATTHPKVWKSGSSRFPCCRSRFTTIAKRN